ncbi:MAG: MarR family winged helix-turn-helix transcriptional regulator [Acidimicrobiales bacterium]
MRASGRRPSGPLDSSADVHGDEPALGDLVFRVTRRLRHSSFEVTAPFGLNPHQVRAMRVIQGGGDDGIRPTVMARRLMITPRSATEVIDALVAKGLAERGPDPADRRAVRVTLSPDGRELVRSAEAARTKAHTEVFSCLTETEQATLRTLLTRVDSPAPGAELA